MLPQLSLRALNTDPLAGLTALAAKGPVSAAWLGRQRLVYVSEPGLVEEVFYRNARRLSKRGPMKRWWRRRPRVFIEGPEFNSDQPESIQPVRRLLAQTYSEERALAQLEAYVALAERLLDEAGQDELDLFALAEELTAAVALRQCAGVDLPLEEARAFASLYREGFRLYPSRTFRSDRAERLRAEREPEHKARSEAAQAEIAKRMLSLAETGDEDRGDILRLFRRGKISQMLFLGMLESVIEPLAMPLAELFLALASQPELERGLAAERHALGGAPGLPPLAATSADEAVRLGSIWRVNRIVQQPFTVQGRGLRPGDIVLASPFLMQRDPRFWERPDEFHLGHWDKEAVAARPRLAYFPFGFSNRRCSGKEIGLVVIAAVALAASGRGLTLTRPLREPLGGAAGGASGEPRFRATSEGLIALREPRYGRFQVSA